MKNCRNRISMSIQEAKDLLNIQSERERRRNLWIGIGIAVLVILVALIIWLAKKNAKDIEEHYEYFDDYDDYEGYDDIEDFDEGQNGEVEYVKIKTYDGNDDTKKNTEEDEVESGLDQEDNLEDYYASRKNSSIYDPEVDDIEGVGKYDARNYNTDSYNEDLFDTGEDKKIDEAAKEDKSKKNKK